ncbi:hypothetical protein [Oceanobacillus sp. ISL-73]|uniref:Uncharacterized protein n=1 Tax=Oceanobacillus kimchii TaxID=746691 RepID=A0ABQ5TH92_9BACI|nr:hypothetical protein [Oceanobacillus sp. ISL-73]GLO65096.1 hypothetical protein MACH08_08800 [Oceanobacillus kimchii]
MECLAKIIASVISILTTYNLWLTAQKKKLEIEKLKLENRRKRRGT